MDFESQTQKKRLQRQSKIREAQSRMVQTQDRLKEFEKKLMEERKMLEDEKELLKERVRRLEAMEADLVERSIELRKAEKQVWQNQTQLRQRQLRAEQCCVDLEKERQRLGEWQSRLREEFPLSQKRSQQLRNMEKAFLLLLQTRAKEDQQRRQEAEKNHKEWLKKRQQEFTVKQVAIKQREDSLRRSQQSHRGELSSIKRHIVTNEELEARIRDWVSQQLLFTGTIPPAMIPAYTTLEQLFWVQGKHPTDNMFLFHGTDSTSRRSIQTQGPKIDRATRMAFGPGFYTTPDPNVALRYAESRYLQRASSGSGGRGGGGRGGGGGYGNPVQRKKCMSPVLMVFQLTRDQAKTWQYGRDFRMNVNTNNLVSRPPYYIVVTNQEKLDELRHIATLFLEERC